MYLKHFNLHQRPFENTTDPRFFWFNENFAEAHAALEYGLQENKGFMLLIGETGAGKTALIHAFIETINPEVSVAVIPDPDLDTLDFYNFLSAELGFNQTFRQKGDFLIFFKRFLKENAQFNGKLLIVVDEAQRAGSRLLNDIRLLDNLFADKTHAVTMLLVGQPALVERMDDPDIRALKSRLAVHIAIKPLNPADTAKYVGHRLTTAGAQKQIFTPEALETVHRFTGGNPLQVNNLCDRGLLTAYAAGVEQVEADMVAECARELEIARTADSAPQQPLWGKGQTAAEVSQTPRKSGGKPRGVLKFTVIAIAFVIIAMIIQFAFAPPPPDSQDALKEQASAIYEQYQKKFEKRQ